MALVSQSLLVKPRSLPFFQEKHRTPVTPLVQPLTHTAGSKGRDRSICLASSGRTNSYVNLGALPIYPLPVVLFPGITLSLQISEFRFQIMMNTVVQTDHRFGVLYSNPIPSTIEHFSGKVGCVAEVVNHQRLADNRFSILCKGLDRFRIAHIERTKPYMVSVVTLLEDLPIHPKIVNNLEKLASAVEGNMKDVIKLAERLEGRNQDNQNIDDLDFRKGQSFTTFSFFVASCFHESPKEQQELLEMIDPDKRMVTEREMLKATINYLRAVLAVKDAFPPSS